MATRPVIWRCPNFHQRGSGIRTLRALRSLVPFAVKAFYRRARQEFAKVTKEPSSLNQGTL